MVIPKVWHETHRASDSVIGKWSDVEELPIRIPYNRVCGQLYAVRDRHIDNPTSYSRRTGMFFDPFVNILVATTDLRRGAVREGHPPKWNRLCLAEPLTNGLLIRNSHRPQTSLTAVDWRTTAQRVNHGGERPSGSLLLKLILEVVLFQTLLLNPFVQCQRSCNGTLTLLRHFWFTSKIKLSG